MLLQASSKRFQPLLSFIHRLKSFHSGFPCIYYYFACSNTNRLVIFNVNQLDVVACNVFLSYPETPSFVSQVVRKQHLLLSIISFNINDAHIYSIPPVGRQQRHTRPEDELDVDGGVVTRHFTSTDDVFTPDILLTLQTHVKLNVSSCAVIIGIDCIQKRSTQPHQFTVRPTRVAESQ